MIQDLIIQQAAATPPEPVRVLEWAKLAVEGLVGAGAVLGAYLAVRKFFADQEVSRHAAEKEAQRYRDELTSAREAAAAEAKKYAESQRLVQRAADIEARKPFAQKQQEIYLRLVEATAIICTRYGEADWEPAKRDFWILFWGAVPIVADESVSKMVDRFAEALDHPEQGVPLLNASMDLARACRASMGVTWSADFESYAKTNPGRAQSFQDARDSMVPED